MILTYKYRIKGRRAVRLLSNYAASVNFVWNYCVATQRKTQKNWKNGSKARWKTHYDFTPLIKGASVELGIHAQTIQVICKQFVQSRDQHKVCPGFRKTKGPCRSLGWIPFQQQSRQLNGNVIKYLGNKFRFFGAKRRPLPKAVKGGAFIQDAAGHWFVCLFVEVDELPTGSGVIGIDLGLKHLAVTSEGEVIENIRPFRKLEQRLAVAQRARNKQRIKAIHQKIKNTRQDYLHKVSACLAKENKLLVVGNVSSSRLAKTCMSKSVQDASWSTFRSMLCYKASRHKARYLEVDEKFTTQRCSSCQVIPDSSPKGMNALGIRVWKCSICGITHDRDVNAAKNILILGLSAQPPVEGSRIDMEKLCQAIG